MSQVELAMLNRVSPWWLAAWLAVVCLSVDAGCGRNAPRQPAAKRSQKAAPQGTPAGTHAAKTTKPPAGAPPVEAPVEAAARQPVDQSTPVAADVELAGQLYAQHCAACHGDKGDGQGLAARFLFPKPRDFRAGRFRLISTTNGVPTQADIDAVLLRGMPGSAMISWAHLNERDRRLLAEQVLEFRRQGARDIELAAAKEAEETLTETELKESVDRVTTPGEAAVVPALGAATPEVIARGKELYLAKGCLQCHGKEGKGDGQEKMVDAEGLPTRPRDLTLGIYKGNADAESVYRRIWLGMPGTPMPSSSQNLSPQQVGELVHFVLSLSDEATRAAAVLRRERIVAVRVAEAPSTMADNAWANVPVTELRLTPLWWRDQADPELAVQAVHDGKTVAVRLHWNDSTRNASAVRADEFEDMAGVQWYAGDAEPFLGMGAVKGTVDLWQWRGGMRDSGESNWLADDYPFDTPVYLELAKGKQLPDFITARVAGNPLATRQHEATSLAAAGPGSLTFLPQASQAVESAAEWKDGAWTVVMRRPLVASGDGGLTLVPGQRYSVAFAAWDGAVRDRAGQKLVTMWNDLTLD